MLLQPGKINPVVSTMVGCAGAQSATERRVDAFWIASFPISEINLEERGPQNGPQTEATILSMSRLETAMNRLDTAIARLDAAVSSQRRPR